MPRSPKLVLFVVLLFCGWGARQAQAADPAKVVTSTSSRAMLAVARLLTEDTWNPVLDKRIQEAPAAARLGTAWQPSDARWQKARAALAARMRRVLDAYGTSEIDGFVQTDIGRIGPNAGLDAAVAALGGPASAELVRQQARMSFIVSVMTARPDGPQAGSPEWNTRMRDLGKRFDDRVGAALPPEDAARRADVEKLAPTPAWSTLSRVWTFAVGNATRQMNTALNLMMLDDRAAIDRDIAAAIGGSGGAAGRGPQNVAPAAIDLERLASCKDSWLDWKDNPALANAYVESFRAAYTQKEGDAFFVPISRTTAAGLPVTQVYPGNIGMAVGFSIVVDAPFDRTKKAFEHVLGRSVTQCETGEGMHTCELELGEKKTFTMLGDSTGKIKTTLVGCGYFYEK